MTISNVRRLEIEFMAKSAIPDGGGLTAGIEFLSNPERVRDGAKRATQEAADAIVAVRSATEPNPFKNWTDEQIAGEILRKVWEKRGKCPKCGGSVYHTLLGGRKCFTCDR